MVEGDPAVNGHRRDAEFPRKDRLIAEIFDDFIKAISPSEAKPDCIRTDLDGDPAGHRLLLRRNEISFS